MYDRLIRAAALALVGILALSLTATAQRVGTLPMRYYPPEEYGGSDQNWAVVHDQRGAVFFGNRTQPLIWHDGVSWFPIKAANLPLVTATAVGRTGLLYVGTEKGFGLFAPDSAGMWRYQSIHSASASPLVQTEEEVRNILVTDSIVYFCTRYAVYEYRERSGTLQHFPRQVLADRTFLYNDQLVYSDGNQLCFMREGKEEVYPLDALRLPKGEASGMRGGCILGKDTLLLAFTYRGLVRYDAANHRLIDDFATNLFAPDCHSALCEKGGAIYTLSMLPNGNVGIGFIYNDILSYLEIDKRGRTISALGVSNGLRCREVTALSASNTGDLWLTHDNGITRVECASPLRHFRLPSSKDPSVMAIIDFKGTLYLGTSEGLYKVKREGIAGEAERIPGYQNNVWGLVRYRSPYTGYETLLAVGDSEYYRLDRGSLKRLPVDSLIHNGKGVRLDSGYGCGYTMLSLRHRPGVVIANVGAQLCELRERREGGWTARTIANDPKGLILQTIVEGPDSSLWLSSKAGGVYRLRATNGKYRVKCFIEPSDGKEANDREVFLFGDTVCVASNASILRYLPRRDTLVNYPIHREGDGATYVATRGQQLFYVASHPGDSLAKPRYFPRATEGNAVPVEHIFERFDAKLCTSSTIDSAGVVWIGTAGGLWGYDPSLEQPSQVPFHAFISRVTIKDHETPLFGGVFWRKDSTDQIEILPQQPKWMIPTLEYFENAITFHFGANRYAGERLLFRYWLDGNDANWTQWDKRTEANFTNLSGGSYQMYVQAKDCDGNVSRIGTYRFVIREAWYRTWWALGIYIIVIFGTGGLVMRWHHSRLLADRLRLERAVEARTREVVQQSARIEVQYDKLAAQKAQLEAQQTQLIAQRDRIDAQKHAILESISYASRIQRAILPPEEYLGRIWPDHFILYSPSSVVSGDFYWVHEVGSVRITCVADCTGHGVPGGFMSMLGMTFLRQVYSTPELPTTAEALERLRDLIIRSLHQSKAIDSNQDGMDVSLFSFDTRTLRLEYSGAYNPLIIIREGRLLELKGDRTPVGISCVALPFGVQRIQLEAGDLLYAFTDGFKDQFGGEDGRRFMAKQFRELLKRISLLPTLAEQREALQHTLDEWRGELPQNDDITVLGIRILDRPSGANLG